MHKNFLFVFCSLFPHLSSAQELWDNQRERIDPRNSSTEPCEALSLHRAHVDPPTEALNLDDLESHVPTFLIIKFMIAS